jgi:hypothetical protein
MRHLILPAMLAAFVVLPGAAFASEPAPGNDRATLQSQIDALKAQVQVLQRQVGALQSQKGQTVCIAIWCMRGAA